MSAIVFEVSVPRFLAAKSAGRVSDWFLTGPLSGLSLRELPRRALPGPRWVRLEPIASGVCGSDLALVRFESSPALEPFSSFPAVLGHEVVARVVEVGREVTAVREGDRVALDPTLSCEARGFDPPCASCAAGAPGTCARAGDAGPAFGRGTFVGFHADLPGGWGPDVVAHESQLHVVPASLSDDAAVLTEPLSVAMHAVLQTPLERGPALVIGSGPIALGTVWALRAAGFDGAIVAQTKRAHEAALAKRLGATETVTLGGATHALLATGAKAYRPILGPEVYAGGGFPLVFDCVGGEDSLAQAMRFVAPRGRVVLLGCAGERRLDLSFLWAREVTLQGFLCYGREKDGAHTFDVTLRRLVEGSAPIAEMITHRFPRSRYREALAACTNRAKSGAIKVLFTPG